MFVAKNIEDNGETIVIKVEGQVQFQFLKEDKTFQQLLVESGNHPSASVDHHASNRLTKFCELK